MRELVFRRPIQLSLLTERRERAPYGLDGGEDGEQKKKEKKDKN